MGDRPAHNTWASPSVARPAPGAPGVEVSPGTLGVQCGALSLQTRALAKKPASGQEPRLPPNPLLTPHLPAGRTMQVAPQAGWAGPSGLRPPTVPPAAPQAEATVQRGPHPSPHPAAPAACAQRALSPAPAHHTLTQGHTRDVGAPPAAAEWRRTGTRPLYSLQEAENFLSATTTRASTTQVASRAAMTMAAMAPGPSEPAEDGGRVSPGPGPPGPPRSPPASPGPLRVPGAPLRVPGPSARTRALVQALPRRAVLRARHSGGSWGPGGRGLPGGATALHGAFSRWQLGGLVPQGGHRLLRALGCKAKDRSWGPGGTAHQNGAAFPQLTAWERGLCARALGLS